MRHMLSRDSVSDVDRDTMYAINTVDLQNERSVQNVRLMIDKIAGPLHQLYLGIFMRKINQTEVVDSMEAA